MTALSEQMAASSAAVTPFRFPGCKDEI